MCFPEYAPAITERSRTTWQNMNLMPSFCPVEPNPDLTGGSRACRMNCPRKWREPEDKALSVKA
tara:strand:+ start:17937 stop:18128 length:192 start_codon:yes stop_codon:yes gene_type:complete